MNGRKLGTSALIFLFGATLLVPALITDIASAQNSWMNNVFTFQSFDNLNDNKWEGTWDPQYDSDWQAHYGTACPHDCDLCERNSSPSHFRCGLYGCAWVR